MAGIISAVILFSMLFSVGTGYFLFVNTTNTLYVQSLSDRTSAMQAQLNEALGVASAAGSNNHLTLTVTNNAAISTNITGVLLIDPNKALYTWLRDEVFGKNLPYDKMVTALLASNGVNTEVGPVNFLLKLMRKDAYIVNTARGGVIDEDTLVKLIEAGDIGGAGLDVYEHEPAVNPKLVRLAKAGKVTLLPHMGSATIEGRVEMGEKVIINIRTFLDNHKPPDRVLLSML